MAFKQNNRREFLKAGATALAATALASNASSYAAILGANDRVKVGIVGGSDLVKISEQLGENSKWAVFHRKGTGKKENSAGL